MLDILGNIGDFVGGIGVVVTLIYLAAQIRQNSKVVRSSAAEAVMRSTSEFFRSSSESRELAQVVAKAMHDFDGLDEAELTQFHLWLFGWFRLVELCYHHYSAEHIPDNFLSGQVAHLGGLMQLPPIRHLWKIRKKVFSEDFQEFVEPVQSSGEAIDAEEMMQFYGQDDRAA
jgi:Na+-transporting methylmalonyl-CoA/oxaloacetate decarboxylase gamma subunit